MSHATERAKLGRKPISIVELEMDTCTLVNGTAPCTATGEPCYNTRGTCTDTANFDKATRTYAFVNQNAAIPVGENLMPCVKAVSYSPTKLTFGEGLSYRSKVSVTLQDFKHHDNGIDPYISQRTHDTSTSTFFLKFFARNQYYVGRILRIKTGYFVDSTQQFITDDGVQVTEDGADVYVLNDRYQEDNFEVREYIIDKVSVGVDGVVKITGIDILKKIDNKRSQCPEPSTGVLSADITDTATSFTLTPSGIGSEYTSTGTVRIGKELMTYTTLTGDVISGVTRGALGSTASTASADDTVQLCKVYTSENVVDILYDQLVTYAGIDTKYIPYNNDPLNPDEWDTELVNWLSLRNYSTVISKPTGVQTLIEELTEQSLIMFWWDELAQKIKLKAIAPPMPDDPQVTSINDDYHILGNSISVKNEDSKRYTELWVYYGVKDWIETKEEEDYTTLYIKADLEKEGSDLYGDKRIKKIKSRWYTLDSHATIYADRFLAMSKDTPKTISFKIDAKDSYIKIGEFIDISSRSIVDFMGNSLVERYHVTEVKETKLGSEYQITVTSSGFAIGVDYAYIAPNTAPDYGTATDDEKDAYAFIAPNTGNFPDDKEPYQII